MPILKEINNSMMSEILALFNSQNEQNLFANNIAQLQSDTMTLHIKLEISICILSIIDKFLEITENEKIQEIEALVLELFDTLRNQSN
jgi:hypothetical protein